MNCSVRFALLAAALTSVTALAQTAVPPCPNIVIVFDVSGSMRVAGAGTQTTTLDGGAVDRYEAGRDAVAALLNSGTPYRYGLELFGDVASGGGCGISPATCSNPGLGPDGGVCNSVTAGSDTASAINGVLGRLNESNVAGSTPTDLAIDVAKTRADLNDTSRGRYVLLVTDGDPNTCNAGTHTSIGDDVASMNRAEASLNALRTDAGVKTYVVGFANGVTPSRLNRMAVAGGTARDGGVCTSPDDRCFYVAGNATELQTALNEIVAAVGGEFGGGGCDDSCYAQGCNAGSICKDSACVADPCASVSCDSDSVCVEGACKKNCTTACRGATSACSDGTCVAKVNCPQGCTGRNKTCVQGTCQEDYCASGAITCPAGYNCIANTCSRALTGTIRPDGGTSDSPDSDGDGIPDDEEGPGATTADGGGCCTGAPGAFSVLGLLFAASTLALLRRRWN